MLIKKKVIVQRLEIFPSDGSFYPATLAPHSRYLGWQPASALSCLISAGVKDIPEPGLRPRRNKFTGPFSAHP